MSIEDLTDSGNALRRREFLVAGAGAGFALSSAAGLNYGAIARAATTPVAKGGSFKWGVASGMPSPTRSRSGPGSAASAAPRSSRSRSRPTRTSATSCTART